MSDRQHTPTRHCPHRLCLPLHLALTPPAIIVVVLLLTRSTGGAGLGQAGAFWLLLALAAVLGLAVARVINGKSDRDILIEERRNRALGVRLVARPVWAAIAVGCDALVLVMGCASATLMLADPQSVALCAGDAAFFGAAISVGLCGFRELAHKQATRPRRTKRVTVPAAGARAGA